MIPVNTQKSSTPPSRPPIAIAGEIHRQIQIHGDPGDKEMPGRKRNPSCLIGINPTGFELQMPVAPAHGMASCMLGHSLPCLGTAFRARRRRWRGAETAYPWRCFAARTRAGSPRPPAKARPDGAKPHPETGWAQSISGELVKNSNKPVHYSFLIES